MSNTCIVTDSSAQFPKPIFPGKNNIYTVELNSSLYDKVYSSNNVLNLKKLPKYASAKLSPSLKSPSKNEFNTLFSNLCNKYDDIICIFLSSYLNDCYFKAIEASKTIRGGKKIQVFDSKTTSVGLGTLVQNIAALVDQNIPIEEIKQKIRYLIPHTYAVFCISGSSYLFYNGYIDYAQSIVCEMLDLFPVFTIEDGKLNPLEKVRSYRQMVELFQEFIEEFDDIAHISFLNSPISNFSSAKLLREYAQSNFPDTVFTEHIMNLPLATLFGPRTYGLLIIENA